MDVRCPFNTYTLHNLFTVFKIHLSYSLQYNLKKIVGKTQYMEGGKVVNIIYILRKPVGYIYITPPPPVSITPN